MYKIQHKMKEKRIIKKKIPDPGEWRGWRCGTAGRKIFLKEVDGDTREERDQPGEQCSEEHFRRRKQMVPRLKWEVAGHLPETGR